MGEAKRRGTYEERKAEAMKKALIQTGGSYEHVYKRTTYIQGAKLIQYINRYITPKMEE